MNLSKRSPYAAPLYASHYDDEGNIHFSDLNTPERSEEERNIDIDELDAADYDDLADDEAA